MPDTLNRWYIGPLRPGITTTLLDGSVRSVEYGQSLEVGKADAERFDLQPENWAKSAPKNDKERN